MAVHIIHDDVAAVLENLQVRNVTVDSLLRNQLIKISKQLKKLEKQQAKTKEVHMPVAEVLPELDEEYEINDCLK